MAGNFNSPANFDDAKFILDVAPATSTKQSDGTQKTQVVDGSGNVIGATSNALDVNIKSGGGGGGAATIADGADVTQGAKADAKNSATDTTAITIMQVLKQLSYELQAPTDHVNNVEKVQVQATPGTVLTASGQVKGSAGQLMGYVVNSFTTGATVKIWNSLTATGTVVFDTQTFTTQLAPFVFAVPAVLMTTGIYFTLSGTISITPLYN